MDAMGRAASRTPSDQTPLYGQFSLVGLHSQRQILQDQYLMKSIEYQMAGLTMEYEFTPQVKQPEYLMKSIEYRWPFSRPADPAGPLRFCRTLLANRPAGTCWTPLADLFLKDPATLRNFHGRLERISTPAARRRHRQAAGRDRLQAWAVSDARREDEGVVGRLRTASPASRRDAGQEEGLSLAHHTRAAGR
jgi:hypothetical protein